MGRPRGVPARQSYQRHLSGPVRIPPAGSIPPGHPSVTGGQAQSYRGIRRRAASGEASKAARSFRSSGIYPKPTGRMTTSLMCVPHTKIFPNACRLRIKMARISRSLRALHAFIFSHEGGKCHILSTETIKFACALRRSSPSPAARVRKHSIRHTNALVGRPQSPYAASGRNLE
jgi:hypothetical protein